MINTLFLKIVNMSITSSIAIMAVMLIRLLFRKQPKFYSYILWGIVLFRLLCPYSISMSTSMFNFLSPAYEKDGQIEYAIPESIYTSDEEAKNEPIISTDDTMFDTVISEELKKDVTSENGVVAPKDNIIVTSEKMEIDYLEIVSLLWLLGGAYLVLNNLISVYEIKNILKFSKHVESNIYTNEIIPTAFITGVFKPKIYLPDNLDNQQQKYILLHEQTHIRRKDYLFKLAGFVALCMHWFNPLVWLAFHMAESDMEMSCDEAVIKQLGNKEKRGYSQTLLSISIPKNNQFAMHLAFGEGETKNRIVNVLNYKAIGLKYILALLLIIFSCGLILLTNPSSLTVLNLLDINSKSVTYSVILHDDKYLVIPKLLNYTVTDNLKEIKLSETDIDLALEKSNSYVFLKTDDKNYTVNFSDDFTKVWVLSENFENNGKIYAVNTPETIRDFFTGNFEERNWDAVESNDSKPTEIIHGAYTEIIERISEVEPEIITEYDQTINIGSHEIVEEGKAGINYEKVKITYEDGVIKNEDVLESISLRESVPTVVKRGILWNGKVITGGNGKLVWPTAAGYVSSGFVEQYPSHNGIDISAPIGTAIYAADTGVVTDALYTNTGYGIYCIIEHGGYQTVYAHCSELAVQVGQQVQQGQVIAYVGNTGNSTGSHLHFEVKQDNESQDPYNWF